MNLLSALVAADFVKGELSPYCDRIEIAGSIRRKKPWVNDIDIVCIPNNQGGFVYQLQKLGRIKVSGQKLIRCDLPNITLDIYIATPDIWATLLLIRTGSKEHNIKLCTLARQQGMHLHADGSGLTRNGDRIAGDTEESIFASLGIPYKQPEERS
jgi:DNA polymerase (family 10)